jgi:excisionase family DNA binding protein
MELSMDLVAGAKGASRYLGSDTVSERAVYHMVERGHLPVIRKGKKLFFRKSELDKAFTSETA